MSSPTPLPPNSNVVVAQVGESGTTASFELLSVKDSTKNALNFVQQSDSNGEKTGYLIYNVALPSQTHFRGTRRAQKRVRHHFCIK